MIGRRWQFGLETHSLSSNKLHEAETFFNSRPCVIDQGIPLLSRNSKVHYRDHKSPLDPPQICTSHPIRRHLLLGLRRLSLRFKRSAEFCTDPVSYARDTPQTPHHPPFDNANNICRRVQPTKFLIMQISPSSRYFFLG